jgi:hypothetical protein
MVHGRLISSYIPRAYCVIDFCNRSEYIRVFFVNPILQTWIKDNCFTCDGSSTIQVFPLILTIGMAI